MKDFRTEIFVVPEEFSGHRLDRFLESCMEDISRSRIAGLVKNGYVRVPGERARKGGIRVKAGEKIVVCPRGFCLYSLRFPGLVISLKSIAFISQSFCSIGEPIRDIIIQVESIRNCIKPFTTRRGFSPRKNRHRARLSRLNMKNKFNRQSAQIFAKEIVLISSSKTFERKNA